MRQTECVQGKGVNVRNKTNNKPDIDPQMIASTTIIGNKVMGSDGKDLGRIEEIIMDLTMGTITYFVLSTGGVLGIGDKLFAIPLEQLTIDMEEKIFRLNLNRGILKKHPGIDKTNWPKKAEWPIA